MKRIATGACIAVVLIIAFLLREVNNYLFDICIGVLSLFATLEISKLLEKGKKGNLVLPALIFTAVAYLFLLLGVNNNLSIWTLILVLFGMLLVVFIASFAYNYLAKNRTEIVMEYQKTNDTRLMYSIKSGLSTTFNCVYPSLFLLLLVIVNHLGSFSEQLSKISNFNGEDVALIVLLSIVCISVVSDVCAYFIGTLIGGKKLCPSISANKTIAGAIGGIVGGIVIGAIIFILFSTNNVVSNAFASLNITLWSFMLLGLFGSIVTQIGDLLESLLKRRANVKDSGNLLPGHGGLMDRIDGLTLNVLFMFVVFLAILI